MPSFRQCGLSVWSCVLLSWALASPTYPAESSNWLAASSCRAPIAEADARLLFEEFKRGPSADASSAEAGEPGSCVVFLSLGGPEAGAATTIGRGADLLAATRHAMTLHAQPLQEGAPWRRVDLVDQVADTATPPRKYSTGLWGIANEDASPIALLGDVVAAFELLNEGKPSDRAIHRYLRNYPHSKQMALFSGRRSDEVELPEWKLRFTTQAWFSSDGDPVLLYRGHPSDVSVNRDSLLASVSDGADYLLRTQTDDGTFDYLYMPRKDRSRRGYNILRHAGTAFSLLELYQVTNDAAYLEASRKALDYLRAQMQACPGRADALCLVENGEIKLGGHGLTLLAITEYVKATGDDSWIEDSRKLARWIVAAIREDGAFRPHLWTFPEGEPVAHISDYYPGEAILGLLRLYSHDKDDIWLSGARAATRYLINVRDAAYELDELRHDHWLLYSLADLYRIDPDPLFLSHGNLLSTAIQNAQWVRDPEFPDWLGGYGTPPAATQTATRNEALWGAWRLARAAAQPEHLDGIKRTACLGAKFELRHQYSPASAMFLPDPARALGGFRGGHHNGEIRIDFVHHNISALLGVIEMIDQSGTGCEEG